jgi:hypothetical protein
MSPLVCVAAGDRSVMLVVGLEEVAAPCILAGIGVVLVVLPLLAGWLAVAACRLDLEMDEARDERDAGRGLNCPCRARVAACTGRPTSPSAASQARELL